ncbi:putative ribonuclease H-like domain-containing protein [Tanacetum coccineum]
MIIPGTWVKFLRIKDEAPEIIIKFLKQAQVSLQAIVRYLHTDNDIKFINQTLRTYTKDVGTTHHMSIAPTPQQIGVIERRNRTLVEAARNMLIFSKSPLFLWDEAVATTLVPSVAFHCYPKLGVLQIGISALSIMADPASPDHLPASPNHTNALLDHISRLLKLVAASPDHVFDFPGDDLAVEIEEDPEEDQDMDIDEEDQKMDFKDEEDEIDSIQTGFRRSEQAIERDIRWLGERHDVIQARTLSLVRKILELRYRVDAYPHEQVNALRVEVDGMHGSTETTTQEVQTLQTAL